MSGLVGNPKTGFLTLRLTLTEQCHEKTYVLHMPKKLHGNSYIKSFSTTVKFLKFSDARKLCCILPKIETKRPDHRIFCPKDANGIANSEDPD